MGEVLREVARVASEIADWLVEQGGPGQAPRALVEGQIAQMVGLMGESKIRTFLGDAERLIAEGHPLIRTAAGAERTKGGIFFAVAREKAFSCGVAGTLSKRDFYRCFVAHMGKKTPPAPRPPKVPPPAKPRVIDGPGPSAIAEAGPSPGHVKHTTRGGRGCVGRLHERRVPQVTPAEVIVRRRSR